MPVFFGLITGAGSVSRRFWRQPLLAGYNGGFWGVGGALVFGNSVGVKSEQPWQSGRLVRRYKRFLADVRLDNGRVMTVHCPNTGSMKNCILPDSPCWFSHSNNPKRKYSHTWEVATVPLGHRAGINTGKANQLVAEAIDTGIITELQGYQERRAEVPYGKASRVDWLLLGQSRQCYLEVKSVTLMDLPGEGLFPDTISERASRHLRDLMAEARRGHRAVLLFCVQHTGIRWVAPAEAIDPAYAQQLRIAADAGVELLAYAARIEPETSEISLVRKLPVVLEPSR